MRYIIYIFDDWISVHIIDDIDVVTSLTFDDWEHLFTVMTWSHYVPTIHVRMGIKS